MKKIGILIMLVLNITAFSFSLSSLDFDETLKRGETKEKEYVLTNNGKKTKRYDITTDSKNVKIEPKLMILSDGKYKTFKIKVKGTGKKGENSYHITIKERVIDRERTEKNAVYINKVVRIKQKYYIK